MIDENGKELSYIMNHQKNIRNIAVVVAGIDEEYQNSIIEGIIDCAKMHQRKKIRRYDTYD